MEEENIETAAKTVAEGTTGIDEEKIEEPEVTLSPFEEAKLLRDDMSKILAETKEERVKMERTIQDLTLSGRSYAGESPQEKTKDDIATEDAGKFLDMFK